MRRSTALVAGVVLLLAASSVVLWLPLSTCPDCLDLPSKARPGTVPDPLGCPRCDDRGRVGLFNRWTRRPLDADLAELLRRHWDRSGRELGDSRAALNRLAARAGVTLSLSWRPGAAVHFVDDGVERHALVFAWTPAPGEAGRYWLALCDRDGNVLEQLTLSFSIDSNRCKLDWVPTGSWSRDFMIRWVGNEPMVFRVLRGTARTEFPGPEVLSRARRGRLEVLSPEAAK